MYFDIFKSYKKVNVLWFMVVISQWLYISKIWKLIPLVDILNEFGVNNAVNNDMSWKLVKAIVKDAIN